MIRHHIKTLCFSISIALLSCTSLWAQVDSLSDWMKQANECYKNNNYKEAAAKYEQIVQSGNVSANLYFNLGNSYYKQQAIPQAVLNYERALVLDPSNDDAKYNLQQAQKQVRDSLSVAYVPFFAQKYDQLVMTHSVDSWAWSSVIAFLLFLLLLSLYLFGKKLWQKKIGFYFGCLALFVAFISFMLAKSADDRLVSQQCAIVFSPIVTGFSAPTQTGQKLFYIHEGTKVKILEYDADWCRVKLSDNKEGWIKKEAIEVI